MYHRYCGKCYRENDRDLLPSPTLNQYCVNPGPLYPQVGDSYSLSCCFCMTAYLCL